MQPKASTEVPGGTGQEQTSKATLGGFGNESSRELTLLSSSCWTHPKQWFRASSEPSCQGSKPTSATYCVTLGKLFPLFHFPLLQDGDNKSLFSQSLGELNDLITWNCVWHIKSSINSSSYYFYTQFQNYYFTQVFAHRTGVPFDQSKPQDS